MSETDFVLGRIQQEGERANQDFERRLKSATPPLEVLLECEDSDEELRKMMDDMHRRYADDETNPWKAEKFTPADEPVLSIAELEKKFSAPNPWDAPTVRGADAHPDEEEDEPEPIPDRATRFERHVRNMKACVLSKMQEGKSRAVAVQELLEIAGANSYSRQVVRQAEVESPE
ncbi:MAG: hypothetical protein WA690_03130 [Candidatus Acidiferrales bacterium]